MKIKLPKTNNLTEIRDWLIEHRHYSVDELARLSTLSKKKLMEWKIKADVIDVKTEPSLLKVWCNYKDYTASEASIRLGVTERSFKYYLKKHGIDKYDSGINEPVVPQEKKEIEYEQIPIPKTKEEFEKLLVGNGVRRLAKMMNVSLSRVRNLKKKFGAESPRDKYEVENKFNDKEWLLEHYVRQELSMSECARLAGVVPKTIKNWLVAHGITPRSYYGSI
jgi:hypothetical protein